MLSGEDWFSWENLMFLTSPGRVGHKQSRSLRMVSGDSFLKMMWDGPTGLIWSWIFCLGMKKKLVKDGITDGTPGYSAYETEEFKILRGLRKGSSRVQTPDLKRADLVWCKQDQRSFVRSWRITSCKHKNSSSWSPWKWVTYQMTILAKHRTCDRAAVQKTISRRLKQGQATKKEFRNIAWACKDGVKGAKAQLEPELVTDIKSNKKGFCQ